MIIIENLCKAYNDKILFKNFHLEIPDSSFLVISGESGCGKSTLLNMIGGIETPDKGSIIVNGFDVTKKGKKQKYFKEVVGFLFQNFALLENKTVKENLEIIKKSGRTDILINEALEKVGLQKVINKKSLSIIWWRTAESCVSSFNAKEMFDCISRRTNWFLRQKK